MDKIREIAGRRVNRRKEISEMLIGENIRVNYMHPYYKGIGYKDSLCPIAEEPYNRIITPPLLSKMEEKDREDVINV